MSGKIPRPEVSPLLAKLADFLPKLQQANSELEERIANEGRESVMIEAVDKDQGGYIKMRMQLGVFDAVPADSEVDPKQILDMKAREGEDDSEGAGVQIIRDEKKSSIVITEPGEGVDYEIKATKPSTISAGAVTPLAATDDEEEDANSGLVPGVDFVPVNEGAGGKYDLK